MNLEADLTVARPPESLFDALLDARRAADAVPGVRLTEAAGGSGEGSGAGAELRLQVGSSQITYRGRVIPEGADRAGGTLRCSIDAREARGTGALRGRLAVRLLPMPPGTRMTVDAQLEVTGRGESLGEDRFRSAVLRLLRRAAGRLGESVVAEQAVQGPPEVTATPAATPATAGETAGAAPPAAPAAVRPLPVEEPPPEPPPAVEHRPAPAAAVTGGPSVQGEVWLVSDRPVPLSTVPLGGTRLDDLLILLRRRGWIPALALAALVLVLAARRRRGDGR